MRIALSLAFLVVCVSLISAQRPILKPGNDTKSFDLFMFSMTWPGTFCISQQRKGCYIPPGTSQFTIHGLWPNYLNQSAGPEFCRPDMPWDVSKIEGLLPLLRKYWTDFLNHEPQFWQHEWEKHGECAVGYSGVRDIVSYFSTVLDLVNHFNPLQTLQRNGIIPSTSTKYSLRGIQSVFLQEYGFKPQIACYQNYLSELRFCFDKNNAFQMIDCQSFPTNCRDDNIFMPPIPNGRNVF